MLEVVKDLLVGLIVLGTGITGMLVLTILAIEFSGLLSYLIPICLLLTMSWFVGWLLRDAMRGIK